MPDDNNSKNPKKPIEKKESRRSEVGSIGVADADADGDGDGSVSTHHTHDDSLLMEDYDYDLEEGNMMVSIERVATSEDDDEKEKKPPVSTGTRLTQGTGSNSSSEDDEGGSEDPESGSGKKKKKKNQASARNTASSGDGGGDDGSYPYPVGDVTCWKSTRNPCDFFRLNYKWILKNKSQVLSGITVALAQVPEAVSFSFVAGVDPIVGLQSAWIMGIATSLAGA